MNNSLVIGATGIVGGYIIRRLVQGGERPVALSRLPHCQDEWVAGFDWMQGDLALPDAIQVNAFDTLYCTADVGLLASALPSLTSPSLRRVVVFTSTSIVTKINSEIQAERELLQDLADGEQKLIAACEKMGIGWTILRPTIIYAEWKDTNISRLARLIRRIGFMPLAGRGSGLRQPVHAEDLATGAIAAAASTAAINRIYALPGTDTISYREMVGRIFDGLNRRRRIISLPLWLWRLAFAIIRPLFPNANVAMGSRMDKDLVFDPAPAIRDFGWHPRPFRPVFESLNT